MQAHFKMANVLGPGESCQPETHRRQYQSANGGRAIPQPVAEPASRDRSQCHRDGQGAHDEAHGQGGGGECCHIFGPDIDQDRDDHEADHQGEARDQAGSIACAKVAAAEQGKIDQWMRAACFDPQEGGEAENGSQQHRPGIRW